VQPRLECFERRGFVARFEPFGGFQPRAGGFNEGLLMRGVVRRRPTKALQRELAAYANMLHRVGPHLVFVGRGSGWEGSTICPAGASSGWRSGGVFRQKKTPPRRGFPSTVLLLGGLKDGIHLRSTGASVQPQGLVPAGCRTASCSDGDVGEYGWGLAPFRHGEMPQGAFGPRRYAWIGRLRRCMELCGTGEIYPGEIRRL